LACSAETITSVWITDALAAVLVAGVHFAATDALASTASVDPPSAEALLSIWIVFPLAVVDVAVVH
jgi:hypothetical protein